MLCTSDNWDQPAFVSAPCRVFVTHDSHTALICRVQLRGRRHMCGKTRESLLALSRRANVVGRRLDEPISPFHHHRLRNPVSMQATTGEAAPPGTAGGNGGGEGGGKVDGMGGTQLTRSTLERLIAQYDNHDFQLAPIQESILQLESQHRSPATSAFMEMALAGVWRLTFSSLPSANRSCARIKEGTLLQRIDPDGRRFVNEVTWSFPDKSGNETVTAKLEVECKYELAGAGRIEVELAQHKMELVPRGDGKQVDLPDDMEAVIDDLRKTIPFEFFDPSGLLDISYMEPDFRVARFLGKRLAGVRNVFVRKA